MTTKERAEKVKSTLVRVGIIDQRNPMNEVAAVGIIDTAIRAALAEERESCAIVADELSEIYDGRAIRDAIRARVSP